jgi:hypothetical protein
MDPIKAAKLFKGKIVLQLLVTEGRARAPANHHVNTLRFSGNVVIQHKSWLVRIGFPFFV